MDGPVSVEEALSERRSRRSFGPETPGLETLGQLVWAAQGVTSRDGKRAAPSAGALYPLELFVAVGDVEGLSPGVYRYLPNDHGLEEVRTGDVRTELSRAALGQEWVRSSPLVLVFAAVYERTMARYGERGRRYVHMEVGSAAENVYLQATADGWATVLVGAFHDRDVQRILGDERDLAPLGLMPVGRPPR